MGRGGREEEWEGTDTEKRGGQEAMRKNGKGKGKGGREGKGAL